MSLQEQNPYLYSQCRTSLPCLQMFQWQWSCKLQGLHQHQISPWLQLCPPCLCTSLSEIVTMTSYLQEKGLQDVIRGGKLKYDCILLKYFVWNIVFSEITKDNRRIHVTDHFRVLEGNQYLKILNLNLDSRFYSYDIPTLLRLFLFKERRKRLKQEPMFTLMEVVRHVFHANLEAEAPSNLVPCVLF